MKGRRVACMMLASLLAGNGVGFSAQAQAPPIVSVSVDVLPYSNLSNPEPGTVEDRLEVLLSNPRFEANVPIRLGEDGALINSLVYSFLDFQYRNVLVPVGAPDRLHDLSYRLTLTLPVSERWRVVAAAQPGLASDFENIEGNHWRFQGALVFRRAFGQGSTVGLGGAVRNDFGDALVLPVLNLQFETERFRVDLQPPKSVAGYFRAGQWADIGLAARVDGGFYRLGAAAQEGLRVKYSVISLGPEARFPLGTRVMGRVTGGAIVGRRFEIQDAADEELRGIDLESGFFVRVAFELRPPEGG